MEDTYRHGPLLLLSGRANFPLAREIAEKLGESPEGATTVSYTHLTLPTNREV